ncbi:hypothetical protein B0T20DRAFT_492233 [Sordaria brevicollis]|uniref:Uncharacterized protein n=1 Tax=Sordaria brevicollis TaxID=83679 RepID=A0AAE0PKF2_SORBR|nr:hypothetical protein B0T20DRAFT_492233 [Sordaria brevicollis]
MSTHHTNPILDRKVLLTLVPLASLAASHEANPNAHGPINFPEIAQSIQHAAATINAQPGSVSTGSHSTHLTPSLLHGILPTLTISGTSETDTDTRGLTIIPVSDTVTDLVEDQPTTLPGSLPAIPTPSSSSNSGTSEAVKTKTVWATVVQQTETQIVTVIKTIAPIHTQSNPGSVPTPSQGQSWPVGECTDRNETAVNGKCVPKTMVTSTTKGTKSSSSSSTTSSRPTLSSSISFTISSTTSSPSPTTTITTRTTSSSSTTDTEHLAIIPVTESIIDTTLVDYDHPIPTSLPNLLTEHPFRPPPKASVSVTTKSPTTTSDTDTGGIKITPVSNTVTELVNYDTVTEPAATSTGTMVVVIPVSSGGNGGGDNGQDLGQMLGHIQGMGQGSGSSRVLVHPTVSVGTTLSVVTRSDGSMGIVSAPASPTASPTGKEFCEEKE